MKRAPKYGDIQVGLLLKIVEALIEIFHHDFVFIRFSNVYDGTKSIWKDEKTIPAMCVHWPTPLTEGGRFPDSQEDLLDGQFENMVTEEVKRFFGQALNNPLATGR
jgi:hypothetical protein